MSVPNITLTTQNNSRLPFAQGNMVTQVQRQPTQRWQRIALGLIVAFATFLNFFQLQQNGYGNAYYAAGVKSMLLSWSNFFFLSFDPGGFVTIDKPPVAFWLQALCAKVLGFSSWSLFLPQALAGIASTLIIYCLVRRKFGPSAGLLAALMLATTPIVVVMNRDNNVDMVLVCVLLLAVWSISIAVDRGQARWLFLGAALVGLGFNVKMLEAYLVIPAFGLFALLAYPRRWWIKVVHLLIALVILAGVSLSWLVTVDLIPANERPYVGSSQSNSEVELAFGYNGFNRVTIFRNNNPKPATPKRESTPKNTSNEKSTTNLSAQSIGALALPALDQATPVPVKTTEKEAATAPAVSETGAPGLFRLFNANISGQISWFLTLALCGLLILLWQHRPRWPLDIYWQAVLLWGVWLLTMCIYFSANANFHIYYMVMMAPAISALAAITLTTLWQNYRQRPRNWRGWMLPIVLLLAAGVQVHFLSYSPDWHTWFLLLVASLALLSAIVLLLWQVRASHRATPSASVNANVITNATVAMSPVNRQSGQGSVALLAYLVGILALFLSPMLWSTYSLTYANNGGAPLAGPAAINHTLPKPPKATNVSPIDDFSVSQYALVNYLQLHRGNARFLLATQNAPVATTIILQTDEPVMALGGFNGADPILTVNTLQDYVTSGTVRFFYFTQARITTRIANGDERISAAFPSDEFAHLGKNFALYRWIASHCQPVLPALWQPASSQSAKLIASIKSKKKVTRVSNGAVLFDCGALAG